MSNSEPVKPNAVIRTATYKDFELATQWTRNEFDWEMCAQDFLVYQRCYQEDSFWAAENDRGETVGFISSVKHGAEDGFIGCYVVRKDYRGNGMGRMLFDKALTYLDGRNIALCSEPFMYAKYTKNGFGIVSDYGLGVSSGSVNPILLEAADYITVPNVQLLEPVELSESAMRSVFLYDQATAGRDRHQWCKHHLLNNASDSLVAVDQQDSHRIRGYATVCDIGDNRLKIGPVYADTDEIARALVFNLLAEYEEEVAQYDLRMFCMCRSARRQHFLTDALGLEIPWEMKHLFTKRLPQFDREKVYCLADVDVNLV